MAFVTCLEPRLPTYKDLGEIVHISCLLYKLIDSVLYTKVVSQLLSDFGKNSVRSFQCRSRVADIDTSTTLRSL